MGKSMPRWARLARVLALLFLPLGSAGCSGRPGREAGSALWVETENVALLDDGLLSRIVDARIGELFVPLADLGGSGGGLERRPMPELPAGVRLTVVIAGHQPAPSARTVAGELRQIFADVRSRGAVPAGAHFDVDGLDKVAGAASFFKKLRGELGPAYFVSLSLRHAWLDDPKMLSLAGSVDFVVAFLYGQREDEPESREVWDPDVVRRRLDQLEKAGAPYLLGISGVGRATHTGPEGKVENAGTEQAPHTFMWNRGLRLKRGIDPEDKDRPVYTLVAEHGARAGGWEIGPGDEVRLIWPTTYYLRKLLDLVDQDDDRRLLGQLYYRLPAPEEGLSISVENVANALAPDPVDPELTLEVQVAGRGRGSTRFRFILTNRNGEATEYSLLGNNYLQVKTDPNILGRVRLGDFYRYGLVRLDPDGEFERVIRNSNAVRLHVPVIEGHQRVTSGDVVVHRRSPELEIEGTFLRPDGHSVELGPFTWKDGELQGVE